MFSIRKLVAAAVTLTAAVGAGALLPASPASADLPIYTTSTHLGPYEVPGSPPAFNSSTPVLPEADGTIGRPARIVLTGDGSTGTTHPFLSVYPGADQQAFTAPDPTYSAHTWYFQRGGYVGVITPSVNPDYSIRVATPVYRIITYKSGTPLCLMAGGVGVSGTQVVTTGCDNGPTYTSQLWLVGSPGRKNATMDASTGAFNGGSAYQFFSPPLQGPYVGGAADYHHSVIENFSSVAINGMDATKATVVAAIGNGGTGVYSMIDLREQNEPSTSTATWTIVPD